MEEQQMPFSEDIELAMLADIRIEPIILDEAPFRSELFYIPSHQIIFSHMVDLFTDQGRITWELLKESFSLNEFSEVGGSEGLNRAWEYVHSSADWRNHFATLRDYYQRREMHLLFVHLDPKVMDKHYDFGDVSIQEVVERGLSKIALDHPISEIPYKQALRQDWQRVLARRPGRGMIELSPIRSLNLAMGCLHPGDEVVIGAETSFGKTSLAMHFVGHLAFNQKKKVAIFSMEMRRQAISERFCSSRSSVPLENIRRNDMTSEQRAKVEKFIDSVPDEETLFMDDSSALDIQSIISRCRRRKRRSGLDVAVVDYLQLVNPANLKASANRQQEVADISRKLKMLAVELDIVVIALSQLNDQGQLRESRAIGQDADIVMYIREPKKSEDSFEKHICIEKNRNGPTSKIPVHFYPQYVSFGDK